LTGYSGSTSVIERFRSKSVSGPGRPDRTNNAMNFFGFERVDAPRAEIRSDRRIETELAEGGLQITPSQRKEKFDHLDFLSRQLPLPNKDDDPRIHTRGRFERVPWYWVLERDVG